VAQAVSLALDDAPAEAARTRIDTENNHGH
jgi:hypothetical protein